jgi:hypothetical protein
MLPFLRASTSVNVCQNAMTGGLLFRRIDSKTEPVQRKRIILLSWRRRRRSRPTPTGASSFVSPSLTRTSVTYVCLCGQG